MFDVNTAVSTYMRLYSGFPPGDAATAAFNAMSRGGWEADVFTLAERGVIQTDLAALVPSDVTRVLEVGCGEGGFSGALDAADPSIPYRGLDLSIEAVEAAATAFPAKEFLVGNLWEYCLAATHDWDFIVSQRCLFEDTAPPGDRELIRLLDAMAPRGFAFVCPEDRVQGSGFQEGLAAALAASTGVVAHRFTGVEPDFGTDMTGLALVYLTRAGTSTVAPPVNPRWASVKTGGFEKTRSRTAQSTKIRSGTADTDYKTVTADANGLVSGTVSKTFAQAPDQSEFTKFQSRVQQSVNRSRS